MYDNYLTYYVNKKKLHIIINKIQLVKVENKNALLHMLHAHTDAHRRARTHTHILAASPIFIKNKVVPLRTICY